MITGEAGASNRGSSGGDATTTSNIRVEQFPGHEEFSMAIREMEARWGTGLNHLSTFFTM